MTLLIRALVSWLLTLGRTLLVAAGALCLAFGNFVVAWQSFTAQGFEPTPLRQVPMLGPWAEAFGVGDAPIAALYALVLTLTMNVAIMWTVNVLARTLQLFFDLRQAVRSRDGAVFATAPDYRDQTVRYCIWSAALLAASVLIIGWDVSQFNYRYENLFAPVADPSEVLGWAPDAGVRLGEFVAGFIRTAKWGYIGCVVALAVGLEYSLTRVAENWHNLHNALEEAVTPAAHIPAEEVGNRPAVAPAPAIPADETEAEFTEATATSSNDGAAPTARTPTLTDPAPISPPPVVVPPPSPAPREGSMVDVIVAAGRIESFSLAEVQRDSERFVRDGSGRTWFVRSYWEQLIGPNGQGGVA